MKHVCSKLDEVTLLYAGLVHVCVLVTPITNPITNHSIKIFVPAVLDTRFSSFLSHVFVCWIHWCSEMKANM